jgi:putative transposase
MINKNHPCLSDEAQCRLLSIARSSFYYELMGETDLNLDLMVKIDKQLLETPFYGVQQITWHLQNEGHAVNDKRIRRLMWLMRLMPIYQKPDTRCPATHACMCEREQAGQGPQDLRLSARRAARGTA